MARKWIAQVPTSYAAALDALNGKRSRTLHGVAGTTLDNIGGGMVALSYHGTDVVRFTPGALIVAHGGWHTRTTAARINAVLAPYGGEVFGKMAFTRSRLISPLRLEGERYARTVTRTEGALKVRWAGQVHDFTDALVLPLVDGKAAPIA